jgi:hypothetical protein
LSLVGKSAGWWESDRVTALGWGALVVLLAAEGAGPAQIPCGAGAGAGADVRGAGADHWDRARNGVVVRFCDRLAMGSARLATNPEAALEAADEADTLVPDQARALVLRGRALLALSRAQEAKVALVRAGGLDRAVLGEPLALWALARAQRRAAIAPKASETGGGKSGGSTSAAPVAAAWPVLAPPEAIASYRALVPTVGFLATTSQQAEALLEAGEVILDEGPTGAADAVAVFDRLASSGDAGSRTRARAWLALALDRLGKPSEAAFVAQAAVRDGALLLVRERDAAAPSFEALLGVLTGPADPAAGAAHLRAYADRAGPAAPWSTHARERALAMARQKAVASAPRARVGGSR